MIATAILAGCGAGGGSGDGVVGPGGGDPDDPDDPGGGGDWPDWDDGDGSVGPLPEGTNVAVVETLATPMEYFNLRATIPVARGPFPRADGKMPFAIRNWDDQIVEAQVETVTRYPEPGAGADVVEVIGRVGTPPFAAPGTSIFYAIVASPHDPQPLPAGGPVEQLQNGPLLVPAAVQLLLADPNNLRIRTRDCFGNQYVHRPTTAEHQQLTKFGETQAQVRSHGSLMPEPFVTGSNGTLAHLMGVHSYMSTFRQEGMLGLDLRIHNAHSGLDTTDPADDPLGTIYFETLEVIVPIGWRVLQEHVDPMVGEPYLEGDYRVYPIVKPIGGNKLHVMGWQQQFHRRLMVTLDNAADRAQLLLDSSGLGFVKDYHDPVQGHRAYSWWNPGTARYFTTNHQLPTLDFIGSGAIRAELIGELHSLKNHFTVGSGNGQYPVWSPRLGWAHPYGVGYGGMTGGDEIVMFDGIRTAWAASQGGYQLATLRHRMHSDRQANAIFDKEGDPTQVNRWVIPNGDQPYVPFLFYMLPFLNQGDPFGVGQAPTFQVDAVRGSNRQPDYEDELFSFDPHDQQHMIRYTHTPKVLVWLGNDTLAKDDLKMQAEVWHLSYHQFYKNQYGDTQVDGLLAHRNHIAQFPGAGFGFGRGEGWGLDAALSVFAFASNEWRSTKRPWLDLIAQNLSNGIGSCNGFVQATISQKFVNALYRARQQIEQAIIENAFRGMIETVYKNTDAGYLALMEDVLASSTQAFIGPMAWTPGEFAPWTYTAIGPLDAGLGTFCSAAEIPSDGITPNYENYQNWSSFAWGYQQTGNAAFLDKATVQAGGGDLLESLKNNGTYNLGNRAALLAMMQNFAGDI